MATDTEHATETTIEECIEQGKRAFALKKFEQAVDHYATALEIMTEQHGDGAPEAADLYFSYGKALLENAISQSAVLGKEQAEDALAADESEQKDGSKADAFLSFSGDAEDEDALVPDGEDRAVDLFAEAKQATDEADAKEDVGSDDGEDGEPEDDFNAAWEVLDLARALYEKQKDEDDEIKLKLADTYIALGDVSLETEKFDQAITDYTTGTALKNELLPLSSRQIAEAHYKLSMVLDLTSGRLADAIQHAEKALESVEARLAELRHGLSGQVKVEVEPPKKDVKGKGKATATSGKLVRDELPQNMSKSQIEAEIKDLEELRDDLGLKVEELKTSPGNIDESAPALAAKALDRDLNAVASSGTSGSGQAVVNDLTSMVVKKKKKAAPEAQQESGSSAKRKAEEEDHINGAEKKVKVDET